MRFDREWDNENKNNWRGIVECLTWIGMMEITFRVFWSFDRILAFLYQSINRKFQKSWEQLRNQTTRKLLLQLSISAFNFTGKPPIKLIIHSKAKLFHNPPYWTRNRAFSSAKQWTRCWQDIFNEPLLDLEIRKCKKKKLMKGSRFSDNLQIIDPKTIK